MVSLFDKKDDGEKASDVSSVFDSSFDDLARIGRLLQECSAIYPYIRLSGNHLAFYRDKQLFPIVAFFYKLKEAYRLFAPMDVLSDEVFDLFDAVEALVKKYDESCSSNLKSHTSRQRDNASVYVPSNELIDLMEELYRTVIYKRYVLNLGLRRKHNFGSKRAELRSRFNRGTSTDAKKS